MLREEQDLQSKKDAYYARNSLMNKFMDNTYRLPATYRFEENTLQSDTKKKKKKKKKKTIVCWSTRHFAGK